MSAENCPAPAGAAWRPSGRAVAGMLGAVAVLSTLTLVAALADGTAYLGVDVALGLLSVVLVALLPRRPGWTAILLAVLAAGSPTATPPSTAATLAVARTMPFPLAVAVAALGAAGHAVRGLWRPMPGLSFGWWLVLVVVAHAALLAWGALSQARADLLIDLAQRARRAEADRDRIVAEALAEERARIAREMHDVLAHRLSLLATYAGALEFRPDAPPERLAHAAGVVRAGVHQSLEELRDVIGVLRGDPDGPAVPPPAPGIDRLADLVEETRDAGTDVELTTSLDGDPPGIVGRTAYRVIQEGLTNARKHAPGRPVTVRVAGRPGTGVEVSVTNPAAAGQTSVPGSGTGLLGLSERVRIVGGRLQHGPDGARFRLAAWLPWQP